MGGGLFKLPYTLGILILLISVISVSYAYFNESETQEQSNVINTKCFEVSMASEGEEITLNEAYPVTDEEGKKQDGYTFTIKNTCNTKESYEVNLEELEVTKKLSNEHIKVSINESKGSIVNELKEAKPTIKDADTSHTLTSGSLEPQEEKQYTIKLWMDEETPATEETMEAEYKSKVTITNTYEENTENKIEIAYSSLEEKYVKESERIKVQGTSPKYNIIEYSFDDSPYERVKQESQTVEEEIKVTEENKIYSFIYRDEKGNEKAENITPIMLDQTGPIITLNKKDEWGTNETITIKANDAKSGIKEIKVTKEGEDVYTDTLNEVQKEYTHELEVEENGEYEVEITDAVGNKTTNKIEIDKIDKENPTVNFEVKIEGEKVIVTAEGKDNHKVVKYYYQVDEEKEVEQEGNTYTYEGIKDGIHTFKVRVEDEAGNSGEQVQTNVEIYYERKIEIIGLNGTIQGGKTLTNIVKNGGYESGTTSWTLSNATVVTTEHYEGNHAIKYEKTNSTSTIEQSISTPILNHKYYGSIMVKSPSSLTSGDSRFEWYKADISNGNLVFVQKRDFSKDGTWQKASSIKSITENTYLQEPWKIRNFYVNPSDVSYTDNAMIIDVTETFGDSNEPTNEWMDERIDYFENKAGYLEQTIKSNENVSITIQPEPNYVYENVECDHATVSREGNSYTITNPTKDTICKIKYKVEEVDVTIESETSEITGGKTITNLIKNGGYESGTTSWTLSNATIVTNEHYEGNHALQFEGTQGTKMSFQEISTPILNHKYYGSIMVKSPNGFTSGDSRFQIHTNDKLQGSLTFAHKKNFSKNDKWEKASGISSVTESTYLQETWRIRNFYVDPTAVSYTDNAMIIDITKDLGSEYETNKEWLDNHITYFETTVNLYQDKSYKGGEISIPITIKSGYGFENVSCTNSESTYENGYLKITNITGEVICHLNTKDTGTPTASIKSVTVKDKSITVDASTSQDNESVISKYEYSLDKKNWYTGKNTYTFVNTKFSFHPLYVRVTDDAGNVSATTIYSF